MTVNTIGINVPKQICSKRQLLKKVKKSPEIEYPESYFNGNLLNSDYDKLVLGDFSKFLNFLKGEFNCDESELFIKMHQVFNEILEASHNVPILIHGTNNKYYLVSGNYYMMAYKVLGISPVVKVVDVPKEII